MNLLTYTLQLNDKMTTILSKIGGTLDSAGIKGRKLKTDIERLNTINLSGFSNMLKTIGIGFSAFQIFGWMKEGSEKVHALHMQEAQLSNTMKNMGTYSDEAYEKVIKRSGEFSKAMLFGRGEIIGLQAQLRMVGNIGEKEMDKLVIASADMATKFGGSLLESGNAIAKAVNNPEMMRRLAMQLKIDPNVVDKITKLAKDGKEATARLMLLDIVHQKVGGSAKAAFDADPLAKYNKAMGGIKMMLGEVAISIQKNLAPYLEIIGALAKKVYGSMIDGFGWLIKQFKEGNPWLMTTAIVFGTITGMVIAYRTAMIGLAIVNGIIAGMRTGMAAYLLIVRAIQRATTVWTAIQEILNIVLGANPIGLVVAGVIALIAVIAFLIIKVDGWGNMWKHTVSGAKLIFQAYTESVRYYFDTMVNGLMIGLNVVKKGWYEFKDAVGIGNSSENQKMIAKIAQDTEDRKNAIIGGAKNIASIGKKAANEFVAAGKSLSWNNTSFSDIFKSVKNKLGISTPTIPGMEGEKGGKGGKASSNGLSNSASAIATGGTKTTNITVHIGEMGNNMKVIVSDVKEGAGRIRELVLDELTRALAMTQANAAQ